MSFLTPWFLLGLAALAAPVLIHLIQRERRTIVEFPSLMFLRRIPYRSVRRRQIRHWLLLLVRLAALALVAFAFARPFLGRPELAAAVTAGAREVVVLLDTSYSMGYAERWARAQTLARDAVNALGPDDRASIVLFSSEPQIALRSASDKRRLLAAIEAATPTPFATSYAPALRLAGSILAESALPRREAVLVSDFQQGGWRGNEGVRLPDGAVLTAAPAGGEETPANVAVTPVSLERSRFSNQERVTVTAGVINRGPQPATALAVALEVGGRTVQTEQVVVPADGTTSVSFAPLTISSPNMRATVRIPDDALADDNAFHFVVSPAEPVRTVLVEREGAGAEASLYLARALAIGDTPRFEVTSRRMDAVSADDLQLARLVILNDVPVMASLADRLAAFVENGGGLWMILGERAAWPAARSDLVPVLPGGLVDRTTEDPSRLSSLEFAHPVFELFRTPRSGDFSAARFYGYRAVTPVRAPGTTAAGGQPGADGGRVDVLARFDDGAVALAERQVGRGRVLVWTSTLDLNWNDLALKPIFLPFVQRVARHLSGYTEPTSWTTVGQVVEPGADTPASEQAAVSRVAITPSGRRVSLDDEGLDVLELSEPGFYEIRSQGRETEAVVTIAANVDLAESDLTAMDPGDVVVAATGGPASAGSAGPVSGPSAEAQEQSQRIWWYLLFGALVLLGLDTALATRLSRRA